MEDTVLFHKYIFDSKKQKNSKKVLNREELCFFTPRSSILNLFRKSSPIELEKYGDRPP